eukprot:2734480-Alexandrium_andersonii.AAC.2
MEVEANEFASLANRRRRLTFLRHKRTVNERPPVPWTSWPEFCKRHLRLDWSALLLASDEELEVWGHAEITHLLRGIDHDRDQERERERQISFQTKQI